MCLEVCGTSGAHMKNKKKGLEAAFALLLLKFVLTCYFASSVFLTKCDPRPFCSAGEEGTIVGLSLSLIIPSLPIFLPVSSDSSVARKLGGSSVVCRAAGMLSGEKQRVWKSSFHQRDHPMRGGAPGLGFRYKIAREKVLQEVFKACHVAPGERW